MARHRLPLAPVITAAALTIAVSATLHAEEGDYGFWQTLANLVNPPPADNPVTR